MGVTRAFCYAAAVAALTFCTPSRAQTTPLLLETGSNLLAVCTSDERVEQWVCLQYLNGFIQGVTMAEIIGKTEYYCLPKTGGSLGQYKDVVLQFLRANPARRHELAPFIVDAALRGAFPCPQK